MPARKFVFLPAVGLKDGSGHLRRSYFTASNIGEGSSLILEQDGDDVLPVGSWQDLIPGFPGDVPVTVPGELPEACDSINPGFLDTLTIIDRRSSDEPLLKTASLLGTPVLLDDDGPARDRSPFVVDTIPGPRISDANISSPLLLDLPPRSRIPDGAGDILVSFGGRDPGGLTVPVLRALADLFFREPTDDGNRRITAILPAGVPAESLPQDIEILEAVGDLKHRLAQYGLVICSYGLTLWEALSAGCAVLAVDPTEYHASLSQLVLLPGTGRVKMDSQGRLTSRSSSLLHDLLRAPEQLNSSANETSRRLLGLTEQGPLIDQGGLPELLRNLEAPHPTCAACGSLLPPVVTRYPLKSYYRCTDCGITGMYRFRLKVDEYGPDYFNSEYRAQYGRSYLQDFEAIKAMARPRLKRILRRCQSNGRVLDVGCAYGPFLDAARDSGFRPIGTDISNQAVAYVRNELGIPAHEGRFPSASLEKDLGDEKLDALSMWYVIEHFPRLMPVLEAVGRIVKAGGVFAFSTPNGAGISARRSLSKFHEMSPADHYTIWTPASARRILARAGFKVYSIRITGHHPERFPGNPDPKTLLYRVYGVLSRVFGLGDTFEVYAVKENTL